MTWHVSSKRLAKAKTRSTSFSNRCASCMTLPRARRYLRELLPEYDELKRILSAAEEECLAELMGDEDDA